VDGERLVDIYSDGGRAFARSVDQKFSDRGYRLDFTPSGIDVVGPGGRVPLFRAEDWDI